MRNSTFWLSAVFFICCCVARAEIPATSLSELFSLSETVAHVHIDDCASDNKLNYCNFRIIELFKGHLISDGRVCTHKESADGPGLRGMSNSEAVVFMYRGKECAYVRYGYRGFVRILDGFAFPEFTNSRGGQEKIAAQDFFNQILALAK